MDKRFEKIKEVAYALYPKKTSGGRCFHLTGIFWRSRLISIGINNYKKSHPIAARAGYRNGEGQHYISGTHSELSSIIKLGEEDCSDYDFYNIRILKNGDIGGSKPCFGCSKIVREVGFNSFKYTDDNGELIEFKG